MKGLILVLDRYTIGFFTIVIIFALINLTFVIFNFEDMSKNIYVYMTRRYGVFSEPYTELFIGLFVAGILTLIIGLFFSKYLKFWLIKIYFTFFVVIFQEYIYFLDAYFYYTEAIYNIDNIGFKLGTHSIINITNFMSYFVGNSYFSLKALYSFIGFISLIILYRATLIINIKYNYMTWVKYMIFLMPSMILFTSHIGKDVLNLFFVSIFIYSFLQIIVNKNYGFVFLIVFSILGSLFIRPWWPLIFSMTIVFYYMKLNSPKNILIVLLLSPIFLIIMKVFMSFIGVSSINDILIKMNDTLQNLSYGGSSTSSSTISSISDYLILFIPNAFTAIFRPLPFDISNPLILLSAIENSILLYLSYKYIFKNIKLIFSDPIGKMLIVFIIAWSLLYSIISPGNLGMAIRFKLQILPALIILIFYARTLKENQNNISVG